MRFVIFSTLLVSMLLFFASIVRMHVNSADEHISKMPIVIDQEPKQDKKIVTLSTEQANLKQERVVEKGAIKPQSKNKIFSPNNEVMKIALFNKKNEKIKIDDYGNYLVDISVQGTQSQEIIISDWPIFFPSEAELMEGIKGCSTGGYYVDANATLSVIFNNEDRTRHFHYTCKVGTYSGEYYFKENRPSSSVLASIKHISETQAIFHYEK